MNRFIIGIIAVPLGLVLTLARERFARWAIKGQNATWGFRFGQREVDAAESAAVVVGVAAVLFGLLALIGVIPSPEDSPSEPGTPAVDTADRIAGIATILWGLGIPIIRLVLSKQARHQEGTEARPKQISGPSIWRVRLMLGLVSAVFVLVVLGLLVVGRIPLLGG